MRQLHAGECADGNAVQYDAAGIRPQQSRQNREQRRLARALVADPDVLIIDEPIAGLDPKHALDTARRLQLLAKGGKLVIASIHDLTLAGRYASRIFALSNGRAAGDGPTQATLTPALIRSAFEVEACVSGTAGSVYVDYALPP